MRLLDYNYLYSLNKISFSLSQQNVMSTYFNIFEKHLSILHSYQAFHFEAELLFIWLYRIEDIKKNFPIFGKDRAEDLRDIVVMFEQNMWSKLFPIYSC